MNFLHCNQMVSRVKNYSGNGSDIDFTESTGTFTFYGSDSSSGDAEFVLTDEAITDWYDPVSPQSVYISENDNLSLAFGYANPHSTWGECWECGYSQKLYLSRGSPSLHPWGYLPCPELVSLYIVAEKRR